MKKQIPKVKCIECKAEFPVDSIYSIKQRGYYGNTFYICKPCYESKLPKNKK